MPAPAFAVDGYSVEVWRDAAPILGYLGHRPAELSKFRQLFEAAAKPVPEKNG